MKKILAVCGNGMGTSSLIKMKIQKVCDDLNVPAKVDHASISQGKTKAPEYDVIVCSNSFVDNLKDLEKRGIVVIGVRNLMSDVEIREKLVPYLEIQK